MNFLSKKVIEYQKKKLAEAENNLQYHISKKEQVEQIANVKEIEKIDEMIKIWSKNIEVIKKEIKKVEQK